MKIFSSRKSFLKENKIIIYKMSDGIFANLCVI